MQVEQPKPLRDEYYTVRDNTHLTNEETSAFIRLIVELLHLPADARFVVTWMIPLDTEPHENADGVPVGDVHAHLMSFTHNDLEIAAVLSQALHGTIRNLLQRGVSPEMLQRITQPCKATEGEWEELRTNRRGDIIDGRQN